ncbi:hypothetical protein VVD49_06465 [Uliginosibacterium sp. H3]|uniref:DUF4136 domain-containing protein n=1 Tax=Uliginosibacterium silvisoli TaxID=3114758 RepID=A0ABU6K091_9RHOO|nr:hypothetical protein [Uliginosibacterium sp. H3]
MISARTGLLMVASAAALAGCATGRLEAQWSDPQAGNQPLAGAKVLVVCQAAEQTIVRICQDQLAAQLRLIGVTPVMSEALTTKADGDKFAAARELGAKAVMLANLSPTTTFNSSSGPSFGIGMGSGGYHSGVGFGMTVPIGGYSQTSSVTSYGSDTTLTLVAGSKLVWSGKASTNSLDVSEQVASLARVSVEAAHKAGAL